MRNIFMGNDTIKKVVAEELSYTKDIEYGWFTQEMYFQAFFYLSKRFGQPKIMDEYKDAGTWDFRVKNYRIRVTMNTGWVTFIMFGELGRYTYRFLDTPYAVKYDRARAKHNGEYIDSFGEVTNQTRKLLNVFCKEHNLDDTWDNDRFWKEKGDEWLNYIYAHNSKVMGFQQNDIIEKHGETYMNSYRRHALKTLRQFIRNMLTPIYVRDAAFNIQGYCGSEYDKYYDNIEIEFLK